MNEINCKPLFNPHCHSSASLLDGAANIKAYIKKAKEYNHPAITLTDHGSMQMVFALYKAAKEEGVKPIVGCEFYITTDLENKIPNRQRDVVDRDKHIIVLAKNDIGYKNMCKLNYKSLFDGFYYKPRITYDQLFENKEGLIVTTACAAGQVNALFTAGRIEESENWFKKLAKEFGEDFYAEIQLNEITAKLNPGSADGTDMDQKAINDNIIALAKKYNVKVIIGGDSHYADKEDSKLQDILINCMMRKDGTEGSSDQSFIHARHLYYQSSEDFYQFNKDFGYEYKESFINECFSNSLEIVDKCNFEFNIGVNNYPKFDLPVNVDHTEYCSQIAYEGLQKKIEERMEKGEEFSDELLEEYEKRLDYEIKVISDKGYIDYFLVYWDLVKWAKDNDIAVGPGRGSCAGSLLSYCLNITIIDPLSFGLYFERFMNPERNAFPDIDSDFEQGERERVREYLKSKYGQESVFGVSTWTLYQPKSALQDASRGLGKDTSFGSTLMMEVTKLPDLDDAKDLVEFFDNVKKTFNLTPTMLEWFRDNEDTIYWANKLLGLCKNVGTHAGGIVVAPGPIYDYIPVVKAGKEINTAFRESDGAAKDLSELGLLKLDILGLKTLNVIKESINNIRKNLGVDITNNVKYLNLNDKALLRKFNQGNNVGIFQMTGETQNRLIKSIQPDCFEDIVAINAINRPGPLEAFSDVFGEWKRIDQSRNKVKIAEIEEERYPFEFMKEPLSRTYGCLLYQEQFMLMVQAAAGFNMGEADSFRRAIGWKEDHPKYHTVKKYFDKLKEGMLNNGYSEEDVEKFLEYCRNFMGYSFNLSHCVSYSYLAMQTLYLKVYYPAYFYAELLNVSDQEEYQSIIADAIANGIDVLPPSINKSQYKFTVENNNIRIGLRALKGFGGKAMEELESFNLSQYDDIYDIIQLPFKKVNKGSFQCLVDVGAFDEFGVEREKIEVVRELFNEPKIEKWFTRASKALDISTMPECLFQFPEPILFSIVDKLKDDVDEIARINEENKAIKKQAKKDGIEPILLEIKVDPWKKLIIDLIPYIKTKPLTEKQREERAEEILGFSMEMVRKLSQLMNISSQYPELNLKSLTARESEYDLCYFFVINKTTAKTQKGKPYLNLTVTDNHMTVKMKCWDMIPIDKGKAYVGHIGKNDYGYSLKNDNYISEIPI